MNRRAFTLVEMLVVITIIGILASMITAAAVSARRRAKIAAVVIEVKQLETALQAYKEKFGEYPPDFAGLHSGDPDIANAERMAVLRHLAKAFPRYQPANFAAFLSDAGFTSENQLTPQTALVFWLGGIRDTNGVPSGFAADPQRPFATPEVCTSRIHPFYEFDVSHVGGDTTITRSWMYWPVSVTSADVRNATTRGPVVYFRAENGQYVVSARRSDGSTVTWQKQVPDAANTANVVFPAADWRIATAAPYSWINPRSFQIFSSGMDGTYGTLSSSPLQFPIGENYAPETYDDITNFSGGTLEDAIP